MLYPDEGLRMLALIVQAHDIFTRGLLRELAFEFGAKKDIFEEVKKKSGRAQPKGTKPRKNKRKK